MEKKVVEILGLAFKMFLRYWARDSKVLGQNLVDAEQFAFQCGLSIWEAKKLNRSIDEYVDVIAEDFIKEVGVKIKDEERRSTILNQIKKDFEVINSNITKLNIALSSPEELQNLMISQSQQEISTWSDSEVGVYNNCVRYISKVSIDFISRLPRFTTDALKAIITRQDVYQKELMSILEDIHSMTSLIRKVDDVYQEYEELYREKLIYKYSKVELIGSGLKNRTITKYDISSSYVELSCINEDEYDNEIELSHVFLENNIIWIKGEAGSGKTTFLQWIAICAAKNEYHKINNIENTVPIVIGLRSVEWPLDLQAIANKITETFGHNCPEGWILQLLEKNRLILLFDGLDEINQVKREETYSFIEEIVEQYPKIKILLTARNSINDCINCESSSYEIMPMKIDNIKKFIFYWHKSVLWKDAVVTDEEITRLQHNLILKIIENQPIRTLAKNPLLCAMICALNFINCEQLPNGKMELYDKCCEMLMDARDNQRNIDTSIYENVPRMDYGQKRKILEEMAYWMLNGGETAADKRNVVGFIRHLLADTNILANRDKEYNAEAILDYFIERSGIIRAPEDGKVDFIHKTFMEFLAVKAICRNCAWAVLIKEACNVNWKETIIMCFQEMGKENVEFVLRKMIIEGEFRQDSRYILMASLGASNAVFLSNNEIKEQIDKKIREMIPPKHSEIYEMAQAGTYLLPFLKDTNELTNSERERCLRLLDYLETEEAIPDIVSYIVGMGNDDVKQYALSILSEFGDVPLEEYNVKDELVINIISSVKSNTLTVYEAELNLLNDIELSEENISILGKVKTLQIICGTTVNSLYLSKTDFLWYLKDCEGVTLSGEVYTIDLLSKFSYITDLTIDTAEDLSGAVQDLSSLKNLFSVRNLCIRARKLKYLCESDLKRMRNLEKLEIHCHDESMELVFDSFIDFPNLQKVSFDVGLYTRGEIVNRIPEWKKWNADCEFIVT